MQLFTEDKANTKLAKSGKSGEYLTIGLFMSPYTLNGLGVNLCPFASTDCIKACLNTAGRAGIFPAIAEARKRKAQLFLQDREAFYSLVKAEIARYLRKAEKQGKRLVVRLNGTTDIDYPAHVFEAFPSVVFYDYTKSPYRMQKYLLGKLPANYHVTFSFSGENREECVNALKANGTVAVVFASANFPETWEGFRVVSGDETDLRFLDPKGVVIGLKAKGKAKTLETGSFVQIDKR